MSKLDFDVESSADEEFFGTLRGRSNLDQLFGVERNDGNQTLKYQPNKRSEPNASTMPTNDTVNAWQTQMAKVSNAYRAGQSVGKVGVALMYNSANAWQMILYKSKTQVLSTVPLLPQPGPTQQLYLQNRYLQYYDVDNVCWSLLFDKTTDEREFLDKLQEIGVQVKREKRNEQQPNPSNEVQLLAQPELKEKPSITAFASETTAITAHDSTDANHKHSKTALISRMAKMGQQLPRYAAAATTSTTECSDSSDTEVIATPGSVESQHKPIIVPRSQRTVQQSHTTQIVPIATAGIVNGEIGVFTGPAMESQFMQMLLTENRTQNTEMRMNMNKLEGKLEKVLDKIDCLHSGNSAKSSKEDEILELEEKLLELKKENRKLRQSLESRPRTVDSEDELQARILRVHRKDLDAMGLATPTNNLTALVADLIERIHTLQSTAQEGEGRIVAIEQRLQQTEERLQTESVRNNKVSKEREELQIQLDKLQEMLKSQTEHTAQLEQAQGDELKRISEQLSAERSQTASTVKAIMNDLFVSTSTKLDELNVPQKDAILAILGRRIRELTLKAIEQTPPPPPPSMANQ